MNNFYGQNESTVFRIKNSCSNCDFNDIIILHQYPEQISITESTMVPYAYDIIFIYVEYINEHIFSIIIIGRSKEACLRNSPE